MRSSSTVAEPSAAERRLRVILDSSYDYAVVVCDDVGVIESWNVGAQTLLGWPEGETLHRPLVQLGNFADLLSILLASADHHGRAQCERELSRRDGSRFWAQLQLRMLRESGSGAGYLLVIHDRSEQRAQQRALQASEERFELALQASGTIGTWDWDLVTNRVVADARFAQLYGVPPHRAAYGAPIVDFFDRVHPEDRDRLSQAIDAALSGGVFFAEYRLVQDDGSDRWVYARGRCYFDETGRPVRFPGAAVDITEQKQVEQALREADERTRDILESISDAFYAVDGEWRFSYVNHRAEELWGLPREQLIGRVCWEVFPQLQGSESWQAHQQVARTRLPLMYETRSKVIDRWIEVSIYPRRDGLAVYFRDISGRKRTEQALRDAQINTSLALGAAQQGTWDFFPETGELRWDDRCRELFGLPPGAPVTYETYLAGLHPDDRERMTESVNRAIAPGAGAFYDEYRTVSFDGGRLRWLATSGQAFFENERCTRFIGVVMDITERKRSQEHQQLLVHELNHRVKNSLATVQAVAEQTLRNAQSLDTARHDFSARLIAMAQAHDILTQENWGGADLHDVVTQMISAHSSQGERFTVQGPPLRLSPKSALAMSMALHELATNAHKYGALSLEGGEVELRWSLSEDARGRRLSMRWTERGGPPVVAPTRRGFGSRLVERGLAAELEGEVALDFSDPRGLVCHIDAPLPATLPGEPA